VGGRTEPRGGEEAQDHIGVGKRHLRVKLSHTLGELRAQVGAGRSDVAAHHFERAGVVFALGHLVVQVERARHELREAPDIDRRHGWRRRAQWELLQYHAVS